MSDAKRQAEDATGVSNITYNVMAVLTNKLQGIATIEEYKKDCQGESEVLQVFDQIQDRDRKDVEQLRDIVANRLR